MGRKPWKDGWPTWRKGWCGGCCFTITEVSVCREVRGWGAGGWHCTGELRPVGDSPAAGGGGDGRRKGGRTKSSRILMGSREACEMNPALFSLFPRARPVWDVTPGLPHCELWAPREGFSCIKIYTMANFIPLPWNFLASTSIRPQGGTFRFVLSFPKSIQ